MAISGRKLDVRVAADRAEIMEVFARHGIDVRPDVFDFAASHFSEDWLVLWAAHSFSIRTSKAGGTSTVQPSEWAELVQAAFRMQNAPGIAEQIRRLGIQSHESLDTSLAFRVAGRYVSRGFKASFEPNGKGCTDLLIENSGFRLYLEVKRENEQDHLRRERIRTVSTEVLGQLGPGVTDWLEERDLRLEIKLSKLFSVGTIPAIVREIELLRHSPEIAKEQPLRSIADSWYVVLPRLHELVYDRGIQAGQIRGKKAGTPVQILPQNMPILVVFDWEPNLGALKRRIQKAGKQLINDRAKDSNAEGFVVVQASHGEVAKDKIVEYFPHLPTNCLGVVLLSSPGYVISRSDSFDDVTQVMAIAGTPSQ